MVRLQQDVLEDRRKVSKSTTQGLICAFPMSTSWQTSGTSQSEFGGEELN